MSPRLLRPVPWLALWLTFVATFALASLAVAAPVRLPVQGLLRTQAGGPVADGQYVLTFALYDGVDAVEPVWKEIHIAVAVQAGAFQVDVGGEDAKSPIQSGWFTQYPALWLGVKVATDPELPRRPLARLPYAWHAEVATQLAGPLHGGQIQAGTLPAQAVAFGYAGADSKGGAALALQCTGCIDKGHLAPGVLDAKNVALAVAGGGSTVQAELGALLAVLQAKGGQIGVGKSPGNLCALDLGSDGGDLCVDAVPALLTRFAWNDAEMDKLIKDGQLVFRKDTGRVMVHAKGKWRELLYKSICGDAEVDPPEQCDDGQANANLPDKCRITCVKPACGDQITDSGEACDDGNLVTTDACIACKKAVCGDGYLQAGVEQCDDGPANANQADKCRTTCKTPTCGDGIADSGEDCDDGNEVDGDGCSAQCKWCGDGTCQPAKNESTATCPADCPKPAVWLESDWVRWYPVLYPHTEYAQSKAVATCKAAGLRLWRDGDGSASDPDFVHDVWNTHNLGGHDIGYKVQYATSGQQEGHTGTWKIFGQAWADSIKKTSGAANGNTVYVLNKIYHVDLNETAGSWTTVVPQASSVQYGTAGNGGVSGMQFAVVLCAEIK